MVQHFQQKVEKSTQGMNGQTVDVDVPEKDFYLIYLNQMKIIQQFYQLQLIL